MTDKPRKFTINLNAAGFGSTCIDDGEPLRGITGLRLSSKAGELTKLTIDFHVFDVEVNGEAKVILPDRTRESLISLGWTPPDDEPADDAA